MTEKELDKILTSVLGKKPDVVKDKDENASPKKDREKRKTLFTKVFSFFSEKICSCVASIFYHIYWGLSMYFKK